MRIKRTSNQHTHQTNKQTLTYTPSLSPNSTTHTLTLSTPLHTHLSPPPTKLLLFLFCQTKEKKNLYSQNSCHYQSIQSVKKYWWKMWPKFILISTTFSPVVLISFAAVIRNRNWPDDLIITFFLFCFPNWQFWILFNSIQIIFL